MRKLRRPDVTVPTLAEDGVGGKQRAAHLREFEQGAIPASFPGHWTRPDVRGALYAMQGKVCAYCGADISEAGIDVEHFRPKGNLPGAAAPGGYWWLAYQFANYFLSCTVCNQRYKKNLFPLLNGAAPLGYANRGELDQEQRVLLDPVADEVETLVHFDWRKPAGKLVPNPELTPALADRVRRALLFFRVNQKADQRKKRLALQRSIIAKLEANDVDRVRSRAIRYRPHSDVVWRILSDKAPQALPQPEEELRWLLSKLTGLLILKLENLEQAEADDLDRKEAQELAWALAVLWKDPPAGSPQEIEDFLDRRGVKPKTWSQNSRLNCRDV